MSKKYRCLEIGLVLQEAKIPMVITSASVVAGIAAHECVRVLHDRAQNACVSNAGYCRWFDLEDAAFLTWRHERKRGCRVGEMEVADFLPYKPRRDEQVDHVKVNLANELHAGAVELWFDKQIVYSRFCAECNSTVTGNPIALGQFRRGLCEYCHQLAVVPGRRSEELRGTFTLEELGVPAYHYITVIYMSEGEVRRA